MRHFSHFDSDTLFSLKKSLNDERQLLLIKDRQKMVGLPGVLVVPDGVGHGHDGGDARSHQTSQPLQVRLRDA